tara:strand:- start:1036 stop:1398 length:363 start_codon:yes stop_codon:yes gene_type:complete
MPVLTKEFELDDGTKLTLRQAGGMTKLRIENIQAQVFRDHMHFGTDTSQWTEDQQKQFADALESKGAGMVKQIEDWVPRSIVSPKDFDMDCLTSEELRMLLGFVRGDDPEGAIPLDNSSE